MECHRCGCEIEPGEVKTRSVPEGHSQEWDMSNRRYYFSYKPFCEQCNNELTWRNLLFGAGLIVSILITVVWYFNYTF